MNPDTDHPAPDDPAQIAELTLEHYNRRACDFRDGTRASRRQPEYRRTAAATLMPSRRAGFSISVAVRGAICAASPHSDMWHVGLDGGGAIS